MTQALSAYEAFKLNDWMHKHLGVALPAENMAYQMPERVVELIQQNIKVPNHDVTVDEVLVAIGRATD